ncbi:MAG: hypothetical protein UX94_C0007G0001 [Parcubacteria group bacterium GW2011_GWA2_47_21]|nr:MAG: hypothetical protein UX94_C0007G0001 [Parcubacteria group bacterium GW2011_GWA2_47_21]
MLKSIFRILGLTIVVIILLIGGFIGFYFVKNSINDSGALKPVHEQLTWIENFYTTNARYPNQSEFKSQFPDFKSKRGYTAYGLNNIDGNPAQNFSLSYDLSKERSDAVGTPGRGIFGYEGYYSVGPCPRWNELGLGQPEVITYVYPPGGLIYSDLNVGEIYFAHSEQLNEKIPLLNGLSNPRLFQKASNNKTNNIIVTNGNDVVSYEWAGSELKLKNPKKIGVIPTGCPVSSSR